jgi:hypothetical protein
MAIRHETPKLLEWIVNERLRLDPEEGKAYWLIDLGCHRAGDIAGSSGPYSHVTLRSPWGRVRIQIGRMIWAFVTGTWPKNEIDHRDRDPTNDRFVNLRDATSSQNKANRAVRELNECGLKGVRLHKASGLWNARIGAESKSLGYFKNPEDAYAAYVKAAVERFGEFAHI